MKWISKLSNVLLFHFHPKHRLHLLYNWLVFRVTWLMYQLNLIHRRPQLFPCSVPLKLMFKALPTSADLIRQVYFVRAYATQYLYDWHCFQNKEQNETGVRVHRSRRRSEKCHAKQRARNFKAFKHFRKVWCTLLHTRGQWLFFCRNSGLVTPKIIYFHHQKIKFSLD